MGVGLMDIVMVVEWFQNARAMQDGEVLTALLTPALIVP
jgi:hypothetical protein